MVFSVDIKKLKEPKNKLKLRALFLYGKIFISILLLFFPSFVVLNIKHKNLNKKGARYCVKQKVEKYIIIKKMLWILRRTGAVNFFNSINNNYVGRSNSVNFYNGSDSGKYSKGWYHLLIILWKFHKPWMKVLIILHASLQF